MEDVRNEGIALSGHRPFPFPVTGELFNVILVWHSPCGGEVRRELERGNLEPLEWDRACQWVSGIMKGIGKEWSGHRSKYVDAYIEPANLPRPWTPQLWAAHQREQAREILAKLDASIKVGVEDAAIVREKLAQVHEVMGWPTMRGGDEHYIGGRL